MGNKQSRKQFDETPTEKIKVVIDHKALAIADMQGEIKEGYKHMRYYTLMSFSQINKSDDQALIDDINEMISFIVEHGSLEWNVTINFGMRIPLEKIKNDLSQPVRDVINNLKEKYPRINIYIYGSYGNGKTIDLI